MEKHSKADEVDFWRGEIERGLKYRRQFGLSDDWLTYRDFYRHNFESGAVNENLVFTSIASESPNVLFQFPHITVTAMVKGYEPLAYVMEAIDNRLVKVQNLQEECRDLLVDIGTCGIGCMVLGYDSQFGYSPKDYHELSLGESITQMDKKGFNLEYETTIRRGMPWARRTLPDDFLVPWGVSRFSETPWFAFRFCRPWRDVVEDQKYNREARYALSPSESKGDFNPNGAEGRVMQDGGYPEELQPIFMWEIHDKRSQEVMVIASGCDKFLRKDTDILQTRLGLPADVVMFQKDPVFFWGIPEVRYYEGHQEEINETIDQRREFRRNALTRFVTFKDTISQPEKTKFERGETSMWVELDTTPGGKIGDFVLTLQPFIPPDFTALNNDIRESVRMVTGKSKPYMGEQLGKTHITKYETQSAMRSASGRDMEKRERLARFIERIMAKQNEIIFKCWNGKRVEQVIGPDLVSYWVEFSGSDLRSDYTLDIAVDDMAPVDRETKFAEARSLLELIAQDQTFTQMFPEASLQVRRTILTLFPWLNFRQFGPREGVGGNEQQPMDIRQFASQFQRMQRTPAGSQLPNMKQVK